MSGLPRSLATANRFDQQALRAYKAAVERYSHLPWVTGVGIGIKESAGELQAAIGPVIVIHVRRKFVRVPKARRIPKRILGVPTDVVQGDFVLDAGVAPRPQPPSFPLRPGASIARADGSAASLGGVLRNTGAGRFLLTAEHVFTETPNLKPGSKMVHPGPLDLQTQSVVVAGFVKKHKTMDAGIAAVEANIAVDNTALLSGVSILPPTPAIAAGILEKSGRTTDVTQGIVRSIGQFGLAKPVIFIRKPDNFSGKISAPGDSGAIWYDAETHEAIGLHRGSDPSSGDAVATPIAPILKFFGLTWA